MVPVVCAYHKTEIILNLCYYVFKFVSLYAYKNIFVTEDKAEPPARRRLIYYHLSNN